MLLALLYLNTTRKQMQAASMLQLQFAFEFTQNMLRHFFSLMPQPCYKHWGLAANLPWEGCKNQL